MPVVASNVPVQGDKIKREMNTGDELPSGQNRQKTV